MKDKIISANYYFQWWNNNWFYDPDEIPDYDGLYEIINEELEEHQIDSYTLPSIDSMKIPTQASDIQYPPVKYGLFSKR